MSLPFWGHSGLRMAPQSQGCLSAEDLLPKDGVSTLSSGPAAPDKRWPVLTRRLPLRPSRAFLFQTSLPLMLASVVFPLTQHLVSGGKPVRKAGAGEGTVGQRVSKPQKDGQPVSSPNGLDTCFGKTVTESQGRASSMANLPPFAMSAVGPLTTTRGQLTSLQLGKLQGCITFH